MRATVAALLLLPRGGGGYPTSPPSPAPLEDDYEASTLHQVLVGLLIVLCVFAVASLVRLIRSSKPACNFLKQLDVSIGEDDRIIGAVFGRYRFRDILDKS